MVATSREEAEGTAAEVVAGPLATTGAVSSITGTSVVTVRGEGTVEAVGTGVRVLVNLATLGGVGPPINESSSSGSCNIYNDKRLNAFICTSVQIK